MRPRVLVAGIGNLFLSDDGFGPEVARALAASAGGGPAPPGDLAEGPPDGMPEDVRVVDYGIRGLHLAYDLLDGCDALVLVDALPGDGPAGEVTVLQVGPEDLGSGELDAHGMDPAAVLGSLEALGGALPQTYVVGCRPESVEEGIGLSARVQEAVPRAVSAVHELLGRLAGPVEVPARGRS